MATPPTPDPVGYPAQSVIARGVEVRSDLRTDDFDYVVPPELIAQAPIEPRDTSRLLVVDRGTGEIAHRHFRDLPNLLDPGDLLVVNDSRVIAARIHARRATGGRVELLLLRPLLDVLDPLALISDQSLIESTHASQHWSTQSPCERERGADTGGEASSRTRERAWSPWWEALVRPTNRVRAGLVLHAEGPTAADGPTVGIEVGDRTASGGVAVRFDMPVEMVTAQFGEMPLPPYIHERLADANRYQTVYARDAGSAAAPTAGLHFTPELLDALRQRGIGIAPVTLHVGADTFRPVRADRIVDHEMHAEYAIVPDATARAIATARRAGRRVIVVGTTAVRATEAWVRARGGTRAALPEVGWQGWTRLFLHPGADFAVADLLVTNFHVPRSTLLMLVSAFAGRDLVKMAYVTAITARYRFYSFGDACLFR